MKKQSAAGYFGGWTVEHDGTITGSYQPKNSKVRKVHFYPDRLTEPGLILSLQADNIPPEEWTNFIPAWFLACRLAGITRTEIQTDFE